MIPKFFYFIAAICWDFGIAFVLTWLIFWFVFQEMNPFHWYSIVRLFFVPVALLLASMLGVWRAEQ